MKNQLNHNPLQIFYTMFGVNFIVALLHYTIFSFSISLFCLVITLMSYAYMMGMFNRKTQQTMDFKQTVADIKESKLENLENHVFQMVAINPYLVIYLVLIPFLWLGLLLVFSIFIPLITGDVKPFEFSILSWLGLILFGLFVFISHSSAKDALENDESFTQKYTVKLTPKYLVIIKKNDSLSIPWNTVKDIHKARSGHNANYYICIVYESDNNLSELHIDLSDFRVGAQHIYLEDFFIKYWLKANGRDIIDMK